MHASVDISSKKNAYNRDYHNEYEEDEYANGISTLKRYRPRSLEELANRTKFSKKEIQLIYQGFKQECPTGIVNEETFKKIYKQFFPFADTSIYAHLIYSTFDIGSTGFVTFEQFLFCLSTLCRGTIQDRLKWIFTLYDTTKSGKLTQDNFYIIIHGIYSLLGNVSNRECTLKTLREYAKTIFEKFDRSNQGYLTIDDFISYCLKDPILIESIESLRITV